MRQRFNYQSYPGQSPAWESQLPPTTEKVSEENLYLAFSFLHDRMKAWEKRFILKEERPWSDDAVFENGKFLWHYRDLDRNSQWEIRNIHFDHSLSKEELIWKVMLFRIMNSPDFFDQILKARIPTRANYNANAWLKLMGVSRKKKINPFTNAYLINSMACPGQKRDWCYSQKVIPAINAAVPEIVNILDASFEGETPDRLIHFLKQLPAISDFMAYEMFVCFTFANRYWKEPVMKWDRNDFVNVGPGCSLGLRLLFPSLLPNEQIKGLYMLVDLGKDYMDTHFPDFQYLGFDKKKKKWYFTDEYNLDLLTYENLMCETQKVWKMKIGLGKQRSNFKARTANTFFDQYFR